MGIGSTELVLILLVALLLFGAKSLPRIARNLGKTLAEFRRAANEVSREILRADSEPPPPADKLPPPPAAVPKEEKDESGG
jgi:TatA/E family protein of Tat protein translocase